MQKEKDYIAFVDGGCLGNGSVQAKAYGSFHVYDVTDLEIYLEQPEPEKVLQAPVVGKQERFLINGTARGGRSTNNLAEAMSMGVLITWLKEAGAYSQANITIYSDSDLIIKQLTGVYKTRDKSLFSAHQSTYGTLGKVANDLGVSTLSLLKLKHYPGTLMKQVLGH